jgi:hypothetical protein
VGSGENANEVRVFARVDVRRWDGSPLDEATARAIDGATSDLGLCSVFEEVRELGLLGGRVALSYDPDVGHLWAFAHHESAAPLGKQEIEFLKERTNGDWCDGVAAAFFEYLGEHLGLDVQVCWRDPLLASQYPRQGRRFSPWSNLARACWQGDLEAARAALEAGEDVDASPQGLPILHGAIIGSHVAAARLLIERGATVFAGDELSIGRTPLWSCVTCHGQREDTVRIARMLLERGADPTRGASGTTLEVARRRKWGPMVRLLEEFEADAGGAAPRAQLRIGEQVLICRGPFSGLTGAVEQSVSADAPDSARIRIKIFGRDVSVDVPLNEILPPAKSGKSSPLG